MNTSTEPGPSAQSSQTRVLLDRHLEAFRKGDVELTLVDYAPDAVIINGTGKIIQGHDEIRETFVQVYRDYFPDGTRNITIDELAVHGETAYIRWRSKNAIMATDTLIVRNGKIAIQTFAGLFRE
ncbi:nuclear transport factor 2 family protein [Stenotrophomonas maltophilia]|uniref:nuclear transport factor 2 family protein n=1 Tax=Stenotrophomonas geniculata TaxID=86188 RepID=UPI00131049C6|nr:nuclear transport factor 2 family protein [Stenotrophomonas geniculata]MBH1840660.1 nuclear transport factor 2 family protein [Stenotrophomonas maltophilia]